MNRKAIWPDFRPSWIVHDDGDVIVVNKPDGMPSQSADPERPDDIVARLRAHLGGAYVGLHQRLDRDTSGVMVFTRRREANAALAVQFETHQAKKTYVACVTGWPAGKNAAVLRDTLHASGGNVNVVRTGTPGGKLAITRVRVLGRSADRAMLELSLETGRTHQARVQLAHVGAVIAGDSVYGGACAARLMLHASTLEIVHPSSGKPCRFDVPPPPEFDAWLAEGDRGDKVFDDEIALARALGRAVERRWGLGRSDTGERATTTFRLVNEDGDGLPGLAVDVYGDWLVAQFRGDGSESLASDRREAVLDGLAALGFDGVYLKMRPKQANIVVDTRRQELAPSAPVRGVAAPDPVEVLEEGIPLLVRLGDGLSTGLFLDHRATRRRVREMSSGKAIANLFAYTCAFTVSAALGGASRTVSVDVSAAAIERGRANLNHAGVSCGAAHALVVSDVFTWLAQATRRGERFDIVVLDPPSYSSTKRARFVAEDDYAKLAAAALSVIADGGVLLACTNHRVSRARGFVACSSMPGAWPVGR